MSEWAISVKPSAMLESLDQEPLELSDGALVYRFKTKAGIEYAKRVELSGLVKWFQKVEG